MAEETPETTDEQAEQPAATPEEAAPEQPAAEEPVAEEPAAEEPVAEEPAAEEPAVAEPVAEQPAAEEPAASPAPAAPPATPKERKVAARTRRGRRREQEKAKRTGATGEGTPPAERRPGTPQVRQGRVVSDKADKTITVRVDIAKRHRRYEKIVRSSTMLHAHDERNDAHAGDVVRVVECRPMSRSKRWRLVEILERAK